MPKQTADEQQKSMLDKANKALESAKGKTEALTKKATEAATAVTTAQTKQRAADKAVTDHQAEIARLERHVEWVKAMPTTAPVAADAAFGDAEVDSPEDQTVTV